MVRYIILWVFVLLGCETTAQMRLPKYAPHHKIAIPYLTEGDSVGIVCLSSKVNPKDDTTSVRLLFSSRGLRVRFADHLLNQDDPSFGASDSLRAADFMNMINSRGIKAILLYKGGYGSVRTIEYIDWKRVKQNPKWIAGFSDVTMLHLAAQKWGLPTIHSTMPSLCIRDGYDSDNLNSLVDALTGKLKSISSSKNQLNRYGTARGVLTGGNLSLLYSAGGTPADNDYHRGNWILFIEDLNEQFYHLDRMMQNLKQSGKLNNLKGIVVGQFINMKSPERFGDISAEALISKYTNHLHIPVAFGIPAGHDSINKAMYMGREVMLEVGEDGTKINF